MTNVGFIIDYLKLSSILLIVYQGWIVYQGGFRGVKRPPFYNHLALHGKAKRMVLWYNNMHYFLTL